MNMLLQEQTVTSDELTVIIVCGLFAAAVVALYILGLWAQDEWMRKLCKKKEDFLLPCPFCKNKDLHMTAEPSGDKTVIWYTIAHGINTDCGVSMLDSDKEELIRRWNFRQYRKQ